MRRIVQTSEIRFEIPDEWEDKTEYTFRSPHAGLTVVPCKVPTREARAQRVEKQRNEIVESIGDWLPAATVDHITTTATFMEDSIPLACVLTFDQRHRMQFSVAVTQMPVGLGFLFQWKTQADPARLASNVLRADPTDLAIMLASARRLGDEPGTLPMHHVWRWIGRLGLAIPEGLRDPREFEFGSSREKIRMHVVLHDDLFELETSMLWRMAFGQYRGQIKKEISIEQQGERIERVLDVGDVGDSEQDMWRMRSVTRPHGPGLSVCVAGMAPQTHFDTLVAKMNELSENIVVPE